MTAFNRSIPPGLEGEVLSQRLKGNKSSRAIAAWLRSEHGLDVSYSSVARFLKATTKETASSAKAAINAAAAGGALDDLGRLDVHAAKLHELALKQADGGNVKQYLRLVEQLRKVAHTRLHFSGADSPDAAINDVADAAKRLTGRLARIAATRAAGAAAGGAGPDDRGPGSP